MPLELINGLAVLRLSGSPEEMGSEHGRLLRTQIHEVLEGFLRRSEMLFDVPFPFLLDGAKECEPFIPSHHVEELRAMSESSGAPYIELLALNCLGDIDSCYMQRILQCCNFALLPSVSPSGHVLHGRNLDFPIPRDIHKRAAALIVRKPGGSRVPTFSVGWAGFIGVFTGCNSAGVSIGHVVAPTKKDCLSGLPLSLLLRESIETSRSAEQVAEFVQSCRRTCGMNIAVADSVNNAVLAIESTTEFCSIRSAAEKGYIVVDNLSLCRKTGQGRLTYPAGVLRHARMTQLIESLSSKPTDPRDFLRDMHDLAVGETRPPDYRGCNAICNYLTAHSVLFELAEGRVSVSHDSIPAPLGEYHELSVKQLFDL